ncbi:MAG: hypothetical protein IPO22_14495 [Anaerolineales bacterium]|nr:hypothetical protein [Anaerolineales bacterium]
MIFLGPFYAKGAPKGFWWVGIGGVLIGLGGIALAFISHWQAVVFFQPRFRYADIDSLLFLMTGAFALGFAKERLGDHRRQTGLRSVVHCPQSRLEHPNAIYQNPFQLPLRFY